GGWPRRTSLTALDRAAHADKLRQLTGKTTQLSLVGRTRMARHKSAQLQPAAGVPKVAEAGVLGVADSVFDAGVGRWRGLAELGGAARGVGREQLVAPSVGFF